MKRGVEHKGNVERKSLQLSCIPNINGLYLDVYFIRTPHFSAVNFSNCSGAKTKPDEPPKE